MTWEAPSPPLEAISKYVVPRSSTLCAGCPHLGTYWGLKKALEKRKGEVPIINGDIGCYEQGGYGIAAKKIEPSFSNVSKAYKAELPYEMLDTNYIMGGGFGLAQGQYHAGYNDGKIIGLAGDSTFFHADLPAIANAAVNRANVLFIVLDNSWTAMTGHQPSFSTGLTARREKAKKLDIESIVKALGIEYVVKVDPWNLKETKEAIEKALEYDGPAVVIAERVCTLQALRLKQFKPKLVKVDQDKCIGCKFCIELGCPANTFDVEKKKAGIDSVLCVGCGMCIQVCPVNAIGWEDE